MFGKAPTHSYMLGQSNGGRSGLAAAQRYPDDYDGIVSMEPAIAQQAHQANNASLARFISSDIGNWMNSAKIALYASNETAACDALDGLADGIIGNIEACRYVPTDLLCPPGVNDDTCLTQGQIDAVAMIYSDRNVPVVFSQGQMGYPRYGRGGAATGDWGGFVFGSSFAGRNSFAHSAIDQASKVVTNNPNSTLMDFDPTQYPSQVLRLATELDATDPDLSAFHKSGGKLLIWYGSADACVSIYRTADYFDSVRRTLGAAKVKEFARLLTTPSVGHTLGGPGPSTMDLLTAMDNWVRKGQAPDNLVASKVVGGAVQFTRPICQYPLFPRYKGSGDPNSAESFFCSAS